MDILVSLIAEVAGYTIEPIGRQAGYLLFYKSNFEKLADHFKELEGERVRINHCIEEERRNGKEIETDVLNWLEKVDELFERANQLQDDPRVGCFGCLFPNLVLRHQLSRKAVKISEEFIQLHEKGNFNKIGYEPAPDEVAFSSNTTRGGGEKLETRESFKENILKALKDPNARNVGVYGLGGVGKTTLVEEVARMAKQEKLFDVVVKAHVSETPIIEKIQKQIAEMLGLHFGDLTDAGRANRLRHRIKEEKTILVILDNIWTKLDLDKVGIPSGGDELSGFKLLMTSRNEDVLFQMGVRKIFTFRLELLNEEEAWSLFEAKVGDVIKDIALQSVAIKVAKKCGGLPLGIVALAGTLRDREIDVWEDALRQLECFDHEEHDSKIYSVLELSYNSLKSSEMKEFFLLFALLRGQDSEYLLIVGMGLGIFKNLHTVRDARIRLRRIITSLKESCLLLEDNASQNIQMHDSVHEVAIFIACRDKQVFMVKPMEELKWPKNDFMRSCLQIILFHCHIDVLPERLDCPNVKHFNLINADCSLVIPYTFFEGMESLEVLDLTSLNLSTLPTSFRSLTNLKALCLDYCFLENMDAIEALISLEILRFRKSSMNKLPSEIGKLTQLRMLDLSHSGIEVLPPNIISSLTRLEELKMGNTSIKWEHQSSSNQNEKASLVELQHLSNLTALELQIREAWILPRELKLMFEKLTRYKIAIGDVWEWSEIENVSLKTLMLKLGSNIHLEHGIKALIKGVENLYLDEVDGIQNVVYQLNWEGFPFLKHLHVQNNTKIKHIVDSIERNQVHVSFPNLETLVLQNLKNIEQICHGPLVHKSFGKLSIIKVKKCVQLTYLLSFSTVKGLSQLSEIEVCQCSLMKEIVHGGNDSSPSDMTNEKVEFVSLYSLTLEHLETLGNFYSYGGRHQRVENSISTPLFSFRVAFPNLNTLKLSSLKLTKIWDDNQHSLQKLSNLIVENCGDLKYLFSSTNVRCFRSLKWLEISNCHLMEEIIAIEEINNSTSALEEVGFFKLERVILKDMKNLKRIWHTQFEKLKMLQVNNCEKIVVVFSSSMQKSYNNLEMLEVTNCALVEEIFELTSHDHSGIEDTTHMKGITLDGLPKLKKIWSQDPVGILGFGNLENVNVKSCERLEYMYPFYVAGRCSHLKELHIVSCGNIKEIIAENKEHIGTAPTFDFNQLNTLLLWSSNKLKSFFEGNHTLECASLRKIDVFNCPKLTLYKTLSPSSPERLLNGRLPVLIQQAPFILEQVIPNLEWLRLNNREADMILQANLGALFKLTFLGLLDYKNEDASFPYWFLHNVHTLEHLVVEWSSFKNIFQDERSISGKIHTRLKTLTLNQLPHLQHVCEEGSSIDQVLEVLEYLYVKHCHSLTNLLPSSVTFNHLKKLEIDNCNGLINLITSSTAQSLVKLIILKVKNCDSIEEIITGEQNVDIAFINLQILTLESLPKLSKFCSGNCILKFPILEEVVLSESPRMKIFCEGNTGTPILRKVKISYYDEETHWKGNLNDTVKSMFEDKVAFHSFKHLKLSEYPELKESWYNKLQCNVFRSLKYLVVHKCDFLSDVLFQSNLLELLMNLEELYIEDCKSLEAVFDLKGESAGQNPVESSTRLKKLKLSNLPKLRHVWKDGPCNTLRFQNLCEVSVMDCKVLLNIFPLSLCQDLGHLEKLRIVSCGVGEIVGMAEQSMESIIFSFPRLTHLQLCDLTKLKSFYPGKHTLECSSLKTLSVYRCEALIMFSFNYLDFQRPKPLNDDIHDIPSGQTLFSFEMLISNLEQLAINATDALRVVKGSRKENIYRNIKLLSLQCFDETPSNFVNDFHAIFPSLETLQVRNSSFETLFPTKGTTSHLSFQVSKSIQKLWLYELEKLKYIWQDDFPLNHPLLKDLEELYVSDCQSLISLAPSSSSFTNMTSLLVDNCKELVYLITSSTAKSLVKLTKLVIRNCKKMLDVVKIDEENGDIIFKNLEHLEFTSLSSLRSFCYGKHTLIFPSLLWFDVKGCPQMSTFSSGVTIAPYLTYIEVEDEKQRWKGDLNLTIEQLFREQVVFHSFNYLILSEYPELKESWYNELHRNVFRSLKYLVVHKCDFLSNVLFQSNLLELLINLEELDVKDCESLEAVFDLKGESAAGQNPMKSSSQLKKLTLFNLPKLRHVWKEDSGNTLRFQNLCEVFVEKCKSLISLIPLSIGRDIVKLQNLHVSECGVEEIVSNEEGVEELINFMFPNLVSLGLKFLPKLNALFAGEHSLQCKSLKSIEVFSCPKFQLFETKAIRHQQRAGNDKFNFTMYQPPFVIEELHSGVENLMLNSKDFDMILQCQHSRVQLKDLKQLNMHGSYNEEATFPYSFLEKVPNLESLVLNSCSFTQIFESENFICMKKETQIRPRLKELKLGNLDKLQHVCKEGLQIDPILQLLESIDIYNCSGLVKLVASSITFTCLTNLEVSHCHGMINLITLSTAKSLVKLKRMKIEACNLLEDVINANEGEMNHKVTFCNLESLELISLPRLRQFCSCVCPIEFLMLEKVVVRECPRMEIFSLGETSTPSLQCVKIEENDHEHRWSGDLNGTIKDMFDDKIAFCQFQCLPLSDYPELKDLWYGQLNHHNLFCNLKSLKVLRCDFLSHVLLPYNVMKVLHGLQDIEIRDCDSLEAVFDVKGMKPQEISIKQSTQLKGLTLSHLPNLKHIWNEDPYDIISFENLCTIDVSMCQNLLNIFPLSLCQDLGNLEILDIDSCGVEEIVGMVKQSMECVIFTFPRLTQLRLYRLAKLKSFYSGKHTLECSTLKVLMVYRCEALRLFSFNYLDFQQPNLLNNDIHDGQALFSFEKLSSNLEVLTINATDALRVVKGSREENVHRNVKVLCLQCFNETPYIFLNDFHVIFPSLEIFEVWNSSIETLFPTEETTRHLSLQVSKPIQNLWLYELEMLKYIWQEDFPLNHPLLKGLEELNVCDCQSLISLAPSWSSFTNLTSLIVDNCKELVYLITSTTAKSLMKLTHLILKNCENMLDVVKVDEENGDIIFKNLEYLEFTSLSSLRSFCNGKHTFMFPSLIWFVVKGCPQMKIFSSGVTIAPYLITIEVEDEKKRWKGDLNLTIEQLFREQQVKNVI